MQTCVKLLNTIEFGEAEKFRLQCAEKTFVSSITWGTHLTPRYGAPYLPWALQVSGWNGDSVMSQSSQDIAHVVIPRLLVGVKSRS